MTTYFDGLALAHEFTLHGDTTLEARDLHEMQLYTILIRQDVEGGHELDWGNLSIKWVGGKEPELTRSPGGADVLTFFYLDGQLHEVARSLDLK